MIDEAEVLETVRRGWSGGTVRESHQLSVEKVNPVHGNDGGTEGDDGMVLALPHGFPSLLPPLLFYLGSTKLCLPNTQR